MPESKIAVIAGAGPAGLTAAYELLKQTDVKPLVFEQSDAIGGLAQTYNYKGNRIDIGGHRFFSKSSRVMKWWFNILPLQGAPASDTVRKGHTIDYATEVTQEYLCRECAERATGKPAVAVTRPAPDPEKEDAVMLQRPRLSRIFYRRKFFPYPLAITLPVAMRLGLWNTLRIGLSYIKSRLFPIRNETYLDSFFINRFGRRLYETFFRAYTEKVWGRTCSEIRADWGAQRVKGLSLKRAVAQAMKDLLAGTRAKEEQARETSLITRFYYPKFGPGQMWETVAQQVGWCGGEVRLAAPVVGVRMEAGRVVAVTVKDSRSGEGTTVPCDYFISTMPVRELIAMITPAPPAEVQRVAQGLVYRDFLTVGLLLARKEAEAGGTLAAAVPDNWIYVQEEDVSVGRIQVFNNWSPYLVADPDRTVWIGLEYFANEGDSLWRKADRELIDQGVREMASMGMIEPEHVLDACVLRMKKAYPAYFGSYEDLPVVQRYIDSIPNLYLVGRNGMHRYNNQDHSMMTAIAAAECIADAGRDKYSLWEINLEQAYHEEKA